MSEFLLMDGFWMYVWPSFLLTAVVMVWAVVAPWRHHRRLLRELDR